MTLETPRKLLVDTREGETLEFKATAGQREDVCETLCECLNREVGMVILGVARKGGLAG